MAATRFSLTRARRHSRRHSLTLEKPSFDLEMNASCSPLISCRHNHRHDPLPSLSHTASTCPIPLASSSRIAQAVARAMSGVVAGGRDKKRRLIWPGLASVGGGVSHWWQANQEDGAGRLDWMGIKVGKVEGERLWKALMVCFWEVRSRGRWNQCNTM